ncbi:EamA family transporter [Aerosakkonemataceae cyanobacterium BLCC-F154]|uniref:EamA family transporter n=1 Tax=Floridaenema fluviatile BLCC-F154 TaxID=3153640 RepID=A0ABV4YAV7_9CYAN
MAQLENQRQTQGEGNPQTAEESLKLLTEQLQNIQQGLVEQLRRDVNQLESEKSRLNTEIEQMRSQYQQLQSEQQTAEQRVWTQQLAQILATQLQEELRQQQLNLLAANASESSSGDENSYELLAALNSTLNSTLRALQQDINSYQSNFSQQLGRMQSLEQQGEAILEALVTRLRLQLQETYRPERTSSVPRITPGRRPATLPGRSSQQPPAVGLAPTAPATPTAPSPQTANFKLGVILVLISSLMFSLQNIVVRVLLRERNIFGIFKEVGGFITPSPGNSLLILLLRMLLVAPLMAFVVAPLFYNNTWRDIKHLGQKSQFSRLLSVIGSGFCLFLSQFFIYIALGNIPTGVATTIFFVYPTVTILLSWLIFRDKPTFLLVLATVSIYIGGFLTIPSFTSGAKGNVNLGVTTAILSGIAFAVYVVLIKVSRMHPIPFSVVNFSTILFLSAIVLPFFGYQVKPEMWPSLLIGTLVLATTTLGGYLLNNFGVPLIGPPLASVVSASGPALTTMLAFLIIQENLQLYQILGVVLVTVWVIGISAQNLKPKTPPSQPAASK